MDGKAKSLHLAVRFRRGGGLAFGLVAAFLVSGAIAFDSVPAKAGIQSAERTASDSGPRPAPENRELQPGPSGIRPTPPAKPGQTLPLTPSRTIAFDTDEGTALSLDLSPDGRTLVFDMLGDIYVLPAKGGTARAITRGIAFDAQPAWSPDGRHILFLSDRSGAENLWAMDADGSNPRQISLYDDNPIFVSPAWSADGKTTFVSRFWPDRNAYEMWAFAADGSQPMGEALIPNWAGEGKSGSKTQSIGAAPSPDGRFLYHATLSGNVDFDSAPEWRIARRDLATGKTDIIVKAIGDIRLGNVQSSAFRPVVSHDGRTLAYGARRVGKTWLHVRDLATGADRALVEVDHDQLQASLWSDAIPHFAFTPDDTALIVSTGGGIRRIDIASGKAAKLPFTAHVEAQLGPLVRTQIGQERGPVKARLIQSPAPSPDGGTLAFSALAHLWLAPLDGEGEPRRIDDDDTPQFHPSWSPDGRTLAYVTWTAKEGGAVWMISCTPAQAGAQSGMRSASTAGPRPASGDMCGDARKITTQPAFYTHPVFTPDGKTILAVRSPQADRLNAYLEFGQYRDADLVAFPSDGSAAPRVVTSGSIGGVPHFGPEPGTVWLNKSDGVHAISLADPKQDALEVQAVGPGWYFAEGPAAVDDLRISPDGRWALGQIAQQLHLFAMPDPPEKTVNLSTPAVAHRKITDVGADYFGWADGGRTIWWAVGSTFYRRPITSVDIGCTPNPSCQRKLASRASMRNAGGGVKSPETPAFAGVTGVESGMTKVDVTVTAPRDTPRGALLLRGATAITMRGDEIIPNADILIADDHIAAIGKRGSFDIPGGTPIRDVGGSWIVPGFIDTHDHIADIRRDVLDLHNWGPAASLAYGVTTTFDPSSLSIDMFAYQDLVDTGQMIGSRIATTGPAVFSFNDFRSKDEVRAVLSRYRDHYRTRNLKMYRTGNRRVRQWFSEAARELGMTATTEGALSRKLDLTQILDGYSGNEHSIPPPTLYKDVLKLFADSGTSYTLTLQITHGGVPAQDWFITRTSPHDDPKYARFSPAWFRDQKFWQREWHDDGEYVFPQVAASAARFQRMGGLLGVGAHGEVPGLGTHWEMQAYAKGGMTPMEVLHAATIGGARTIARDAEFGSIEPGKYADLVILDRNPLDDIRNTLAIRQVMKNGRLYDADTLTEVWPRERPMEPFWFGEVR